MAKKRKKTRKESSGVSRRDMLKMGGAAGAATILGPTVLTSRKAYASNAVITPPAEPVLCGTTPPASPPTTPFVDNLPIPSLGVPTILFPTPTKAANIAHGEAPRADHQRWEQFPAFLQYYNEARASTQTFHRDLLPSYIWGFNGKYPAPTLLTAYGIPTLVRFKNNMPAVTTSFGRNETTVHLHNGHTGSESDGFAGDFFGTGLFKDNHYANAYAGIDAFGGIGDPREAMHTFWYHDHRAAFTSNNNYLGLNGMYLVYDKTDPGHEFATPGSLRLPCYYGLTDIPLILTDKRFCPAANGRNELFQVVGSAPPAGDKWVVNGKILPKFSVMRRKYRLRILNTGVAKTWNLKLVKPDGTQAKWTVVAVDANFLHEPWDISGSTTAIPTGELQIHVSQRYDLIVDFAQVPVGSSIYLREAALQNVGVATPDPAPGTPIGNVVMRFDVVSNPIIPDTPPIPSTLVELPPIPDPVDTVFEWRFTLDNGQFHINGLPFDANRVDHVILKGTTEEWNLRNNVLAGNWVHPVHIHLEEGRILERTTRPDPVNQPDLNVPVNLQQVQGVGLNPDEDSMNARRDVYPLPGQNTLKIRLKFRDWVGRYMIHCHNMNHEDNFMVVRWDVVDSIAELRQKREQIAQQRRDAGVSVEDGLPKSRKERVG
ncbi:MAG TPA: multicopper oxidase domain-containing protein [Blastocatellia bacterium]|nr:multicopper oxidase domain-containing protein [Blastocatellia bacterium]